jgi:hypothetical protein
VSHIISDKWRELRSSDEGSAAEQIVKSAATLIRAQIREMDYDMQFYPPLDITATDDKTVIAPLLNMFMQFIVSDKLKRTAIAQSLTQAARPRTSLMPLPFAFGVHLDRYSSADLIKETSRLGFCISYDEVTRYKQAALKSKLQVTNDMSNVKPIFVQYIADNVDHNVRTIDGKGTLHAMGIISALVFKAGYSFRTTQLVPRLSKRLTASEVCKEDVITYSTFIKAPGHALAELKLSSLLSLVTPVTLPATANVSLIWSAGSVFDNTGRTNWSGFMQTTCNGEHPPVASIGFLPIINLPPTDVNCVLTTLLFIEKQAKILEVCTPCITFDQPLFAKALDVVISEKLDIVVRLGGFHVI